MAYRFNGTSDYVEFNKAPFTGYTFGACTIAYLVKRGAVGSVTHPVMALTDSGLSGIRLYERLFFDTHQELAGGTSNAPTNGVNSTTPWYLIAMTKPGGATLPRYHNHNGTSWAHGAMTGSTADTTAIAGTDRLRVGNYSTVWQNGDICCIGIKKSNSADAVIETLSRTLFSAWQAFGFDWLIGFEAAGTLNDQASPGTGDETARSGTSVVSDPPSWTWGAPAGPAFVPKVVIA